MMKQERVGSPLCALLSGLLLAACGGPTEAELAPAEELTGTQESAICSGSSVSNLTILGVSSYGGEVAGSGSWSVTYPANAVHLDFYVDGVPRGSSEQQGDSNRSGSWNFSYSPVSCGSHTFEVRAYPMTISSTSVDRCPSSGPLAQSTAFAQGCPTAALTCSYSGNVIACTGSGSGGTGSPYIPFWQERLQFSDGSESTSPWEQGSWSWSVYCAQPATRDEPTYRQFINFKVRDNSGMDSPVRSYSRLCAY
jgi:hypothetical protein